MNTCFYFDAHKGHVWYIVPPNAEFYVYKLPIGMLASVRSTLYYSQEFLNWVADHDLGLEQ